MSKCRLGIQPQELVYLGNCTIITSSPKPTEQGHRVLAPLTSTLPRMKHWRDESSFPPDFSLLGMEAQSTESGQDGRTGRMGRTEKKGAVVLCVPDLRRPPHCIGDLRPMCGVPWR